MLGYCLRHGCEVDHIAGQSHEQHTSHTGGVASSCKGGHTSSLRGAAPNPRAALVMSGSSSGVGRGSPPCRRRSARAARASSTRRLASACTATATDSYGGSDSESTSILVDPTIPEFSTEASISPSSGVTTGSSLSCSGVAIDPDGGTVSLTYEWVNTTNSTPRRIILVTLTWKLML